MQLAVDDKSCRGFCLTIARLRLARILACALPLLSAFGCGTSDIHEINKAAIVQRNSYTDDISRLLALKSVNLLKTRESDYRVGAEDLLEISIFELESANATRTLNARVAESGIISLPGLGEVKVAGMTVEEIKKLLEARLQSGGILRAPQVSVFIREFRSKLVHVVGAVREPGAYTLRQNATSLLAILALAGGVNERAGQVAYVIRAENAEAPEAEAKKTAHIITVDLYELLEQGNLDLNMALGDGDVVNVPEAKRFFVIGYVREPGGFPLTHPTTVLDAIALAGGLQEVEASPRDCVLKRRNAEGEVLMDLDLVAISKGKKPNFFLMPGDILDVRQTTTKKIALEVWSSFKALFGVGYTLNRP